MLEAGTMLLFCAVLFASVALGWSIIPALFVGVLLFMGYGLVRRCSLRAMASRAAGSVRSAGTVVVAKLLDLEVPPEEMNVMLQKEVALRLAADAGDEEYGALSVRARTVYDVEILRMVPPQLFHPKPEVDSCVLRMRKRTDLPPMEFRTKLSQVARLAFSQRRKKMIKQLASVFGRGHVEAAYREIGLPEDIRAERVTVEQFQKLTHFFQTVNSSEE